MGDEEHYLLRCNNGEISRIREDFIREIKSKIIQFETFSDKNIVDYCMNMHDTNIQMAIALYTKNILTTYREETDGPIPVDLPPVITRTGRQIRKPIKLNL